MSFFSLLIVIVIVIGCWLFDPNNQ